MLGNYGVAAQPVASRLVLSSTELVSCLTSGFNVRKRLCGESALRNSSTSGARVSASPEFVEIAACISDIQQLCLLLYRLNHTSEICSFVECRLLGRDAA
jgi:hypothetical protein